MSPAWVPGWRVLRSGGWRGRLQAPVRVEQEWLDQDEVFIVGAGLNYFDHRAEVGGGGFILFPKPVVPSGAYAELVESEMVRLLDYDAEIAFVALKGVNLKELANDQELVSDDDPLLSDLAFFAVNDVTNCEAQILDPDTGYAKAREGYLPSGPWVVAG